mgnify:CR=1 FL=1
MRFPSTTTLPSQASRQSISKTAIIVSDHLGWDRNRKKINIELLKTQFNNQSEFKVKNYVIDLNSREIFAKNIKLKLTEKEINTIIFLSRSNEPVSIDVLQEKVWSYQSDIETHTVETHIYRLRKKILNSFRDNQFIISKKNGYQIN